MSWIFQRHAGLWLRLPRQTRPNNHSHGDDFFIAASPPLQSRACCVALGTGMTPHDNHHVACRFTLASFDYQVPLPNRKEEGYEFDDK
jgi:hypothetical protein